MGTQFLNPAMAAPNVQEIALDPAKLAPALAMARKIRTLTDADRIARLDHAGQTVTLSASRPPDWSSDISWWSADDVASFGYFQRLFDALGLAQVVEPYVDHAAQIRLFAGFFVMRSRCREEDLHVDWLDGNNDGFTLLAPLTGNAAEMGLAYRDFRMKRRVYRYRLGHGLVFGDRFHHATEVGETRAPAVLLCFNFGTDRMDRWPQLAQTTARQGRLHRRPDGVFVRNGVPLATG